MARVGADFRVSPVSTGTLCGVLLAAAAALGASVLVLVLSALDHLFPMSGGSSWSLLSGFVIGPIVALAGLPWSAMVLKVGEARGNPWLSFAGLAASMLANGILIGFAVGLIGRLFRRR
jgi:apolipoprotein N-acyltransferase